MIFWLGILISLVIAALAAKKGLYESWTILFNVIISVYLSITLTPVLIELLSLGNSRTISAIVLLASSLACFGILYGLAYIIFLSQFEVKFPKIMDSVGGGLFGFLAALLAWAFVVFVISTSPMGQNKPFSSMGLNADSAKNSKTVAYMQWWTNKIDAMVGKGTEHNKTDTLVSALIDKAVKRTVRKQETKPEKDEAAEVEPVPEESIKPFDLGPPPELAFEDI